MKKEGKRDGGRTCREVRARLQALADDRAVDTALADHLSGCPRCRRFQELLADFPGRLAAALEAEVRGLPAPSLPAAPGHPEGHPESRPERLRPHPADPPSLGKRLRWMPPAAAAALLALAVGLPLAVVQARTLRGIRIQMSAVVDRAYDRPLAEGVESGLLRVVDRDRVLEELDAEAGLQELGGGSFPE